MWELLNQKHVLLLSSVFSDWMQHHPGLEKTLAVGYSYMVSLSDLWMIWFFLKLLLWV